MMIEDTSLNKPRIEPNTYPQIDPSESEKMWDMTMREMAGLKSFMLSREDLAQDLNQMYLDDYDNGTAEALVKDRLYGGRSWEESAEIGWAIGNLDESRKVTPEISLETAAGDRIAADKLSTDPVYKINTGLEESVENPGITFTRPFITQHAIMKSAEKRGVSMNKVLLNRLVYPTIIGASIGAGVGSVLTKSLGGSTTGAVIGAGIGDIVTASWDYLNTSGRSITQIQKELNNGIYAILNDDTISADAIDDAIEDLFTRVVDDPYLSDYLRPDIIQSAFEGTDPFADNVGIMPGWGFKVTTLPITKVSDYLYDTLKTSKGKRLVSDLKVTDKKELMDRIAKNGDVNPDTAKVEEKVSDKAMATAPDNVTQTEKEIVAKIDTPENIDTNKYTAIPGVESDFPFNVAKSEVDEETGTVLFYHGIGVDGDAMPLKEAIKMMNEYTNVSNWDKGLQAVTTASPKAFKTFRISNKTRKSGEGSESLHRAGYVSSITDNEASRWSYLSTMNRISDKDWEEGAFRITPADINLPEDFKEFEVAKQSAISNFGGLNDLIRHPSADVKDILNAREKLLEARLQESLQRLNIQDLDVNAVHSQTLSDYAEAAIELKLIKEVKNNTNTNLMTLTIKDPEAYPDHYLSFKKPLTEEAQPALKKVKDLKEEGEKLRDTETGELLPDVNVSDAIAKSFIRQSFTPEPIDVYDLIDQGLAYRFVKKNWKKYVKPDMDWNLKVTLEQVPLEDLRYNITSSFDYMKMSQDYSDYFRKEMRKRGIWAWEHSETNFAVYDERAFGDVTKQERYRGSKYEQKFLDNGFGLSYDVEQNGFHVIEIKKFDPSNKKPLVLKENKKNYKFSVEEIFNNVNTKKD